MAEGESSEDDVLQAPVDTEEPGDDALIISVQRWRIIYDKGHRDWKDNSKKDSAWAAVSYDTGMPGNTTTLPLFSHCHCCNVKDKHLKT